LIKALNLFLALSVGNLLMKTKQLTLLTSLALFSVIILACQAYPRQPSSPSSIPTPYPTNTAVAASQLWHDTPGYYPFDSEWKVDLYYDPTIWDLHLADKPGMNSQITNRKLADCILIRAGGEGLDGTQFRVDRENKKLGEVTFELNKVVRLKDKATVWINYCTKDAPQNAATCYQAQSETSMAQCQAQAEDVLATMKFTRESSDK